MGYLTFEDGIVILDGTELPGLLSQLSVAGQVRFDEAKTDGQSGKKKTPMGFDDASINIDLELLTDDEGAENATDCYEKLAVINKIFKDVGAKAAPKIYSVTNRHLRARNIDSVVFSGLSSRETNRDDVILAALTFVEHNPPIIKSEQKVVGATLKDQAEKAEEAASAAAPEATPAEIVIDAN